MSAQWKANGQPVSGINFEPRINGDFDDPAEAKPPKRFWDLQVTKSKVKLLDIAQFASQWQAMEGAGIPTITTLGLLSRSFEKQSPTLAATLADVRAQVEDGMSLGDAFRKHESVFGELTCEMISTGEATGTLERHLGDVAADAEYRHRNKSTLIAAMIEPILIVITGLAVSWVMITYAMPQFAVMYEAFDRDGSLPTPTVLVLALSRFLNSPIGIFLEVAAVSSVIAFFVALKRSRRFRYKVHAFLLKVPLFGELMLLEAVARGCRTLAIVQKSVGNIPMGLELAAKTTTNLRVAEGFADTNESVYNGTTVWEGMLAAKIFPEFTIYMARSGEVSGNFDVMLEKLADTYDTRVKYVRERITEILRYALLLIMGAFVLGIMLAMYLPVFTLIERMSRH